MYFNSRDEILHVKLGISTKFYLWDITLSNIFNIIHIVNVPGLLSIGVCICKLSIIVLYAVDRFICRVATEVTVSVLFSQDHKKCLLHYESIHKKCPILSSQEFARNVNHSYLFSAWRVKDYRYEHGKNSCYNLHLKLLSLTI